VEARAAARFWSRRPPPSLRFGGRLFHPAGGWWLFGRAEEGRSGLLSAADEAQAGGLVHGPLMNPCH
jgi:hypothetical protein